MPGKKKAGYVPISVRIRPDQKEKIEQIKAEDFAATQDSIVRDSIDLYFERKGKK